MTATPRRKHPAKILPLAIPSDEYRRLEELGRAEERDPLQHARWILRQHIAAATHSPNRGNDDRLDS